ncbi:hypothetical protein GRF29_77g138865 [Pseudopithomyces chartarum]|uniref:pH-response regulator protein palC n=1 Tax=Pseudopithomyces chartarum TaxID=1892770 RepID=A0AAN6LXZ0_9PLEO|nr:hypothetical protein GRF29_77g138865 [Pseudopithomyces chartarum]
MPFPFVLPTTSSISFTDSFTSSTHPSLPTHATTARGVVRDVLKRYKRLPPSSQPSNLSTVLAALHEYIPYLFALDAGLSGTPCAGEEIDLVLVKEVEVEWRSVLGSQGAGTTPSRVRMKSLDSELFFALGTLAQVYCLQARAQLHTLYNAAAPSSEQRVSAITAAMKHFLDANSIYTFLATRAQSWTQVSPAVDIAPPVLGALAAVTLAEATLITVLKDDPYPAAVQEDRNKASKEWMFRGTEMPKKEWAEKREDKKIEKGGAWGADAGRFEEGRVVDMLLAKWEKMNDTVLISLLFPLPAFNPSLFLFSVLFSLHHTNPPLQISIQTIPPPTSLLSTMPSGREYHSPKPYAIPTLEEDAIVRMRAPPDPGEAFEGEEDDSEEEERGQLPGAFPVKGGEAYY